MVAGNIEERIKKMKEAILSEAKERALTIVQNADFEANNQRARIFNQQKQKIIHQFSLLNKNERVKQKIEKSTLNNRHRIRRMQARYEFVEKLKEQVLARLRQIVNDKSKYQQIAKQLIVQGMLKMMQRNVGVQVKKDQIQIVQKLFAQCQKQFSQILLKQTGKQMQSKLFISEYALQGNHNKMVGGVFLRSNDGLILCDNSLDSRIKLIFEQILPVIRSQLFPKIQKK